MFNYLNSIWKYNKEFSLMNKCKFIPFPIYHKPIFNFPVTFFFYFLFYILTPTIITAFTFSIDSYHYSVIRQRHWICSFCYIFIYKKTYFHLKLFLQINFLSLVFFSSIDGNLTGSVSYLKVSCCIVNIILLRGWFLVKGIFFF